MSEFMIDSLQYEKGVHLISSVLLVRERLHLGVQGKTTRRADTYISKEPPNPAHASQLVTVIQRNIQASWPRQLKALWL